MFSNNKTLLLCLTTAMFMSGCSSINPFGSAEDPPLPGERVSVLELQKQLEPENVALEAQGFIAPEPWQNEFWPQRGGYPNHTMQNLSFTDGAFEQIWSSSIGQGATKRVPLSIQPIIVGGMVYTLDGNLDLRAFHAANGEQAWATSLQPENDEDITIGGGLAFGEGMIYATNGFSEILAIDPNNGTLQWRKPLSSPTRSAPTVLDKRLYVQTTSNQLLALDAGNGQELWRYTGFPAEAGLVGASSPTASQNLVVTAFSSGELTGINADNGQVVWSDSLAPRRRMGGISSVSDVTGLPVIDRDLVIAAGFGGRMLALDAASGRRVWQRDIGSLETPWVAGNYIFTITTDNKLVALGRESGSVSWVLDLGDIKRSDSEIWTGPVLGGGRLILASSEGQITEINPQDGKILRTIKASGSVTTPPVIANGVLYVLSDNGKLSAYK